MAIFFNDLYSVLDKSIVDYFVGVFANGLRNLYDKANLIEFKFAVFELLIDYEYFYDIISSHGMKQVKATLHDKNNNVEVFSYLRQLNPVISIYVNDVGKNFSVKEPSIRFQFVIEPILNFITKIDFKAENNIYNHDDIDSEADLKSADKSPLRIKQNVATLFLPYIETLMQDHVCKLLLALPEGDQKCVVMILLWIVKHCPSAILRRALKQVCIYICMYVCMHVVLCLWVYLNIIMIKNMDMNMKMNMNDKDVNSQHISYILYFHSSFLLTITIVYIAC